VSQADIQKGCLKPADPCYTFDDDAFVDLVTDRSVPMATSGRLLPSPSGSGTVDEHLTDTDLGTAVFFFDADSFAELTFFDNVAVNNPGTDIVVFDRAHIFLPTVYVVTIAGVSNVVFGGSTFNQDGFKQRAVEIDLDDYGIAPGGEVVSLVVARGGTPTPQAPNISGAAALESDPPAQIDIDVDIKPGNSVNPINPFSGGSAPVAILGSDSFDVLDVDLTSIRFNAQPGLVGTAPIHAVLGHLEDVNDDGFTDLNSHYPISGSGIEPGDAQACVTGVTLGGESIQGCDLITTTNPSCGFGFELAFLLPPLMWLRRRKQALR
jgi:hypothetical protein